MKHRSGILVCGLLLALESATTLAGDNTKALGTSVALASEYAWRGISLSARRPSLQASVDYSRPLGNDMTLEAGVWGYSTKYLERPAIWLDMGVYAGLGGPLAGDWRWGVQSLKYAYPQAPDWNYLEHSIRLSRAPDKEPGSLGLELGHSRSSDVFGSGSLGRYFDLDLKLRLPWALELTVHAGKSLYARPELAYQDFRDWKLAAGGQWQGFDFEVGWIATSGDQFGRMGRSRGIASILRTF